MPWSRRRTRALGALAGILLAAGAAWFLTRPTPDEFPFLEAVPDDAEGYAATPDLWAVADAPAGRACLRSALRQMAPYRDRLEKALAGEAAVVWGFDPGLRPGSFEFHVSGSASGADPIKQKAPDSGLGTPNPKPETPNPGTEGPGWFALFRLTRAARAGFLFADAPDPEVGRIGGVAVFAVCAGPSSRLSGRASLPANSSAPGGSAGASPSPVTRPANEYSFLYAVKGDALVIGPDQDAIARCLAELRGGAGLPPSLHAAAAMRALFARLPAPEGRARLSVALRRRSDAGEGTAAAPDPGRDPSTALGAGRKVAPTGESGLLGAEASAKAAPPAMAGSRDQKVAPTREGRRPPDPLTGIAIDLLGAGGGDGDWVARADVAEDMSGTALWAPGPGGSGLPPSPPGGFGGTSPPAIEGTTGRPPSPESRDRKVAPTPEAPSPPLSFQAPALLGPGLFFLKSRRASLPAVWDEWLQALAGEYGRVILRGSDLPVATPADRGPKPAPTEGDPRLDREAEVRVKIANEIVYWERHLFGGRRFAQDILPLFGPEVGFALSREDFSANLKPETRNPKPETSIKYPLPVFWAFCEVRDRDTVTDVWDRLVAHYAAAVQERATGGGEREGPFKAVRRDVAGTPMVGIEFQGPAARDLGEAFQPAYAPVGRFLVISSYRPALERLVRRGGTPPGAEAQRAKAAVPPGLPGHPGGAGPLGRQSLGEGGPSRPDSRPRPGESGDSPLQGPPDGMIALDGAALAAQVRDLAPHLSDMIAYRRLRARAGPEIERRAGEEVRRQAAARRQDERERLRRARPAATPLEIDREADRELMKWVWNEYNDRVVRAVEAEAGKPEHAGAAAEAAAEVEAWARRAERCAGLEIYFRDAGGERRFAWNLRF